MIVNPRVSPREAFYFWLKLGFISFGGPAGQIAIMHRELVERRRWLSEERFLHALNFCMLLPGPEAQQLATYIGWLLHRTSGGLVAGTLFVLPSAFILLGLSYLYAAHGNLPGVAAVLTGFKPVVVAIVIDAALGIGRRTLRRRTHVAIAALAFVSVFVLGVPFPAIILAAGVAGFVTTRIWPNVLRAHGGDHATRLPSVNGTTSLLQPPAIDDSAPAPPHTMPSRARAVRVLITGALLWLGPLAGVTLWRGWESLHTDEYRFFTQAAFVTFGGAYAVLAYVTQAATGTYGWITQTQALDGLALAETTPGPLVMVLQFVGYVAGWNHPADMTPAVSALAGAIITTYVTFLPCFVFIFLGAPYIEVLRGSRDLAGALNGVTAAAVGMVLNLAVVFGTAVLWPGGVVSRPDWFALILGAVSLAALVRWRLDVVWIVLGGGLIGASRLLVP